LLEISRDFAHLVGVNTLLDNQGYLLEDFLRYP